MKYTKHIPKHMRNICETYMKICKIMRTYVNTYENMWKYPEIDFLENRFSGKIEEHKLKYAGF